MNINTRSSASAPRFAGLMTALFDRVGLNSILRRQTLIAFLFIIGTAVTMGVVGFRFTVNFEHKRFNDHFNLMASYLASNAELGLLLGNEKMLQGLTESMLTVSDVQIVEIVDNLGVVVIRRAHENPLPQLDYVSAPVISSSMGFTDSPSLEINAEEELGRVNIGYSLTGLELLKKQLALGFLLISLLLAVVPVFLYWRLSRMIRAPFKDIMAVAGDVSRGRLDVRAKGGSLQETSTLAAAFNEMLDALQWQRQQIKEANEIVSRQQVLAEVGKFSMMLAHEIKNPLAIIKGSIGVLRKPEPVAPAMKKKMIGFLDEEIARINKLVEDFLLFARPQPPAFQTVTTKKLLYSLGQRISLMEAKVQVVTELTERDLSGTLYCNLPLLERALLNLVRNALEAATDASAVTVKVVSRESFLTFFVQDDGPGISPEDLEKVFEPFFSKKAKGTGLGLAITREAVNAHSGMLFAENCPEGGVRFVLQVPFSVEDSNAQT